ncbi:MAG: methyltransferase [Bdellovibrionales bacterium]
MTQHNLDLCAMEARLAEAGVIAPLREAERIVRREIGLNDDRDTLPAQISLDGVALGRVEKMMKGRVARVPFERLAGEVSFAGVDIELAPDVFKPYPESIALVEHATLLLERLPGSLRLLDLGCGTGCLLLALLQALPRASGVGIDLNSSSVALAQKNAARNGLQDRATFRIASWSDDAGESFDFAICNPPRVPTADIPLLIPEMRDHDPHFALDGGPDGLAFYTAMAEKLPLLVKSGGYGLFQLSPSQVADVQVLFAKSGFRDVMVKSNFYGFPNALLIPC